MQFLKTVVRNDTFQLLNTVGRHRQSLKHPLSLHRYCTGKDDPAPCPKGKFQPEFKQVSDAACKNCSAGFMCSREGLAMPDVPCPKGNVYFTKRFIR